MDAKDWANFVVIALASGWTPEHVADFMMKGLLSETETPKKVKKRKKNAS